MTANANGEFSMPDGKPLMRIKANGEVEIDGLDAPAAPVKVTKDGTLTAAGQNLSWVEGKFNFGDHRHFEITPKDSPSKQAATLMFVIMLSRQEVPQPK